MLNLLERHDRKRLNKVHCIKAKDNFYLNLNHKLTWLQNNKQNTKYQREKTMKSTMVWQNKAPGID